MIYLTYNDSVSGIYYSQVIDVVNYLNTISKEQTKLIAFISIRDFKANNRKIKTRCANSSVYPMFPKPKNWKWNIITLFFILLFKQKQKIMARGVFATNLALTLKKMRFCSKVIFDARGAYHAEFTEYNLITDKGILNTIKELENNAITKTDYKLAVSEKLMRYWETNYNYTSLNYEVIPCTLSHDFMFDFPTENELKKYKTDFGYKESDIIFIYSGSSADWQSFNLVDKVMTSIMSDVNVHLIVLSNHFSSEFNVVKQYANRIKIMFVEPQKVKEYLLIADYGILFREQSITNQVASPVKFAEYLSCGLKILISENIGDYTSFSHLNNIQLNKDDVTTLSYKEKNRIYQLAKTNFNKWNFKNKYLNLLNC